MLTITKYFVDRTVEIERLDSALHSEGLEKELLVLVYGQQGIGKTQLLAKYLRLGNSNRLRIAYVDLRDRDYLGLIDEIVEGLGKTGFDDLDETYDKILAQSLVGVEQTAINRLRKQLGAYESISAPGQSVGINFMGPVTGETQNFINGPVTINNPKIEVIYQNDLGEPKKVQELNQRKITQAFQSSLRNLAAEQPIVLLLDHWEHASDPLKIWLNNHLLKWASQFQLKKALIVLSCEFLLKELEDQAGILPLPIAPFTRETAVEFWVKNELPLEDFDTLAAEVYNMPRILALEVGKRRLMLEER